MVDWLVERRRAGDAIAQHGFQHQQLRRLRWTQRVRAPMLGGPAGRGGRGAEFVGLDGDETRRAVDAGWRVLKLAGIEPDGFVAPAYAYTPALRRVLRARFRWWASLLGLHGAPALGEPAAVGRAAGGQAGGWAGGRADGRALNHPWRRLAPAWRLGGDRPLGRALSPALIRAGAALAGSTLRLDLHPSDLRHPRHMLALESVLGHAAGRRDAVTYDELAAAELRTVGPPKTSALVKPAA